MTVSQTYTTKPWMTELWAWADEFDISEDNLPRNKNDLLALTELNVRSNQITRLPESIGNLVNLTHLGLNCENLEYLPYSLGQLTGLCGLNIPNKLTNKLPTILIKRYRDNELSITNISSITLYKPLENNYRLSEFGFFLIDDDWNEESLVNLKDKAATYYLFGLQTTEKAIKQFDVVDGIIICNPDEVQRVMKMFESIFCLLPISIDYDDIQEALHFKRPAKFIQDSASSVYQSDQVFNQIISQIPKVINIKSLMFQVESHRYLSIDEWKVIDTTIEKLDIEDCHIFYGAERVDNSEYCWMGMIYMVD